MATKHQLRRIKELDKECEKANSLWHSLETIKREYIENFNVSDKELEDEGIYIGRNKL